MITPEQARILMADACAEDMAKVDEAIRQTAIKGENELLIRVRRPYEMPSILTNKGYRVYVNAEDHIEIHW